jgi:hypothetical protein
VEETSFLRSVRILPSEGGAAVSPELLPVRNLVLTCSPTPSLQRAGQWLPAFPYSSDIDGQAFGSNARWLGRRLSHVGTATPSEVRHRTVRRAGPSARHDEAEMAPIMSVTLAATRSTSRNGYR